MGRKNKYSKELKLSIVKRYLEGEGSTISLAKEINTAANIAVSYTHLSISHENTHSPPQFSNAILNPPIPQNKSTNFNLFIYFSFLV